MKEMITNQPVHYIDNKEFFNAMVEFHRECDHRERSGESPPFISDYIGECFLKIGEKLSYRPNFINYSFRAEMVSDGIEDCLRYVKGFDPNKTSNPFGYFTKIVNNSFLKRIEKEKRVKYFQKKMSLENHYSSQESELDKDKMSEIEEFVFDYENKIEEKHSRKRKSKL